MRLHSAGVVVREQRLLVDLIVVAAVARLELVTNDELFEAVAVRVGRLALGRIHGRRRCLVDISVQRQAILRYQLVLPGDVAAVLGRLLLLLVVG